MSSKRKKTIEIIEYISKFSTSRTVIGVYPKQIRSAISYHFLSVRIAWTKAVLKSFHPVRIHAPWNNSFFFCLNIYTYATVRNFIQPAQWISVSIVGRSKGDLEGCKGLAYIQDSSNNKIIRYLLIILLWYLEGSILFIAP